jgi:CDP-diacylglycerol--glycerol-3-phosphate 3-phosphatidyltransferase
MDWPESNLAPSPVEEPARYKQAAALLLNPLIQPPEKGNLSTEAKTVVYPVGQFTPVLETDTSTEHPAVSTVLSALAQENAAGSRWCFTAGYFNIHPELKELLLKSRSMGTVVTAAPEANGFYGSKGVSNMLPPAYTLLSRQFLEDVLKFGKEENIELKEWKKGVHGQDPDAWTYHAKGSYTCLAACNYLC